MKVQHESGLVNAKTASTRDLFIKENISQLMKQKSEAFTDEKKLTYRHCCDYPDEMYPFHKNYISFPVTNSHSLI